MMMKTAFRRKMFVVCLSAFALGLAAAGAKAGTVQVFFTNLGIGGTFNSGIADNVSGASHGGQAAGKSSVADTTADLANTMLALAADRAKAATVQVFTSFGAGGTFSTGLGIPFTAGTTGDLTDAMLAPGNLSGSNTGLAADLESDNSSGQPGNILATVTQQGTIPPFSWPGVVAFDYSDASAQLTTGTQYWPTAGETTADAWQSWSYFVLDAGIDLRNFSGSANGPSTTQSGTIDLGEGDGTPLTLAPEPASVLLLGLALLGILVVARRFRWAM